jgi:CHC2 zinc finger
LLPPALYVEQLTGVSVPRSGKIRCPFHLDSTPSLHVYRDPPRGWYCYGCRRGGSVYDFAALLWGVQTRGAAYKHLRVRLSAEFAA